MRVAARFSLRSPLEFLLSLEALSRPTFQLYIAYFRTQLFWCATLIDFLFLLLMIRLDKDFMEAGLALRDNRYDGWLFWGLIIDFFT